MNEQKETTTEQKESDKPTLQRLYDEMAITS
jgi:hypothetical protein